MFRSGNQNSPIFLRHVVFHVNNQLPRLAGREAVVIHHIQATTLVMPQDSTSFLVIYH